MEEKVPWENGCRMTDFRRLVDFGSVTDFRRMVDVVAVENR